MYVCMYVCIYLSLSLPTYLTNRSIYLCMCACMDTCTHIRAQARARAASAYRSAHARGAVGRVAVTLVRTAARARPEEVGDGELRRGQGRAGDGGVVVCAAALSGAVGFVRTKQAEYRAVSYTHLRAHET